MTIWIYTGDRPSNSAKALCQFDGFKRYRTGKYVKLGDIIVNWGSSTMKPLPGVLNSAAAVAIASNKLASFFEMRVKDVNTVNWTTDNELAQKWCDSGSTIVVRNKLTGHSGDGIIIVEKNQEVPKAPLYTKYIFKDKEFRVHVANGTVIDTQQKIRDPDKVPVTWKVRSHENGFIYARDNIDECGSRDSIAMSAVNALDLDFGAVDIVEDKKGELYVLEVNTAPGLSGQTLQNYAEVFKSWVK